MRKIIYLIEQPLDDRNYDRFGIQTWLDRLWQVEIWDFTRLSHPRVWIDFIESGRALREFPGYFPFGSKEELQRKLLNLERLQYFIDLTGENYLPLRIKAFLIRKGAQRVICAPGSIPVPDAEGRVGNLGKLRALFASKRAEAFGMLGMALLRRFAASTIRPALVVAAGEVSAASAGKFGEVLNVHSFDYDIYLRLRPQPISDKRPYAVFIDQDLCFHPDFVRQGIPFVVTPAKYFPALCKGLRSIGEALRLEIRIAAHPRAAYLQRGVDYFEGLALHFGETADLIRACDMVVCHDSTAIHFAVLFNKPMIFITTDELIPTYEGRSIAKAASEFGKTAINLDRDLRDVDWRRESLLDEAKYSAYRNRYIKIDTSPERPMWDVIIDHVEASGDHASIRIPSHCASAGSGR